MTFRPEVSEQYGLLAQNTHSQRGGFQQGVWLETVDNP